MLTLLDVFDVNGYVENLNAKFIDFPGGEVDAYLDQKSVDLLSIPNITHCRIGFRVNNAVDLMKLFMLTDAIRRVRNIYIYVNIPYMPGARQDRVTHFEALGAKVYADMINAQNYKGVSFIDAHSPVITALINNGTNISPKSFIAEAIKKFKPDALIAPDAGAAKKIYDYNFGIDIICAGKHRNPKTGEITGATIEDIQCNRALIVDDICDGGRTFTELAPLIAGKCCADEVGLYVTHGIFSKGSKVLTDVFDHVYTTDSFRDHNDPEMISSKITVIRV